MTSISVLVLLLFIGFAIAFVALFIVMFVLFGGGFIFLGIRALNPDPNRRLPSALQGYVDANPKVVKGMDPQADAWREAAEGLMLQFEQLPETWTNYGYCILSGTLRGRSVKVSVRSWGNLRYTTTSVEVPPGFRIPDAWGPVLSAKTKQGMAFVAHAPKMKVNDTTLTHEAIGIRSESAEIKATVEALLDLSGPVP